MNKKTIAIYLLVMMCLISTTVFAAVTASLKIEIDQDKIKPGDKITATLSVENIEGTTKGIRSFDGYLEYDDSIFETVKNSDLSINEGAGEFNQETGKFAVDLNNAVLEDADLITVTLTVKTDVKAGEIKNAISFKDVKLATGLEGSVTLSQSLDIIITSDAVEEDPAEDPTDDPTEDPADDPLQEEDNTNPDKEGTNVGQVQAEEDDTLAPNPLPKTGVIKWAIGLIVVLVLGIICYRQYKKIEL